MAAAIVTCSRVALCAVGTFSAIEPDTSMTASRRPGTVTADHVDNAWSTAAPAMLGAGLNGPLGIPGSFGIAAPNVPSGARRAVLARLFFHESPVMSDSNLSAASAFVAEMPGSCVYG